jgi:hypothetical protein
MWEFTLIGLHILFFFHLLSRRISTTVSSFLLLMTNLISLNYLFLSSITDINFNGSSASCPPQITQSDIFLSNFFPDNFQRHSSCLFLLLSISYFFSYFYDVTKMFPHNHNGCLCLNRISVKLFAHIQQALIFPWALYFSHRCWWNKVRLTKVRVFSC